MVGVHVLIGIGEAVITALTVGSVVAVRPDLVYGARSVLAARALELQARRRGERDPARCRPGCWLVVGLLLALALAGGS